MACYSQQAFLHADSICMLSHFYYYIFLLFKVACSKGSQSQTYETVGMPLMSAKVLGFVTSVVLSYCCPFLPHGSFNSTWVLSTSPLNESHLYPIKYCGFVFFLPPHLFYYRFFYSIFEYWWKEWKSENGWSYSSNPTHFN